MIPRAMAMSKFPRLVSMTVAVVSTRVYPLMLPPTMMEAPTSEMTPPNPAITPASRGSLASLTRIQTIWKTGGAEGQNLEAEVSGKGLDGRQGYAHHDGGGDDRLGNDHGGRGVEDLQKSERSVPPKKDGDEEAYHHGRQAHSRVDQTYDQPSSRKSRQGD